MTNKVSIGVEAQVDTQAVSQKINALGQQIAQANKVVYSPIGPKTVEDLNKILKQFDQLRRVQGDLNKRMKATGQGGASLVDVDWEKLYPDQGSRARQMRKAFDYSVGGGQFSAGGGGQPPGRQPPRGGGGGGGGWAGVGAGAAQAGLRAAGPAGGVAAGALGTGMSAGAGAGLMGLMGGMLALGVSKLVGGVMEKVDQAESNNVALDRLKRTLGDVNVSFNALKTVVSASGDNLKITYDEAGRLATQFTKLGNLSGDKAGTLGGELGVGVGMSRAYGLDPSQGVGVMGQMRGVGVTSNTQESRRFALLIGETIGKAGAFAKADEVMEAMAGFATSQTRNNMGRANVGGYAGMYSSMVGSGVPGLDPAGAGSILSRVNSALSAGGAKGESSQFFTGMVGQRMGLDSLQTQVMREGGAFATNDGMFGEGSAYARYMGKTGPRGGSTFLEQTRSELEKQYGGNTDDQKLLRAQAFANHSGLNMNQSMAMLSLKPNQMGGMEKYGDLKNFNAAGIGNLSKVLYGSDGDRQGVADSLMKRKDVSQEEKSRLAAAMSSGDVAAQKEILATLVASKDQEQTMGKDIRDSKNVLDNIATGIADKLVPAVNAMRAGIIYMAGKGSMSERDIMKEVAKLDSKDAQETIKANSKQGVSDAYAEQDAVSNKHKEALADLRKNRSKMSPEEIEAAQANIAKLWREKAFKEEEIRERILKLEEEKERLLKEEVGKLGAKMKAISTDGTATGDGGSATGAAPGGSTTGDFARSDRGGVKGGAGGAPGNTDDAMKFFMDKGWTKEQAAGIVANLHQESGMKPGVTGDGGRAYGVAQWHPDRQAEFEKWSGKSIRGSTVQEQLGFVHHEMTAGKEKAAGDRLRGARSASEAGGIVSRYYERPKARDAEAYSRGNMADRIMRAPAPETAGATPLPEGYRPGDRMMGGGAGAGSTLSGQMSLSLDLSDSAKRLLQPPQAPVSGRVGAASPNGAIR